MSPDISIEDVLKVSDTFNKDLRTIDNLLISAERVINLLAAQESLSGSIATESDVMVINSELFAIANSLNITTESLLSKNYISIESINPNTTNVYIEISTEDAKSVFKKIMEFLEKVFITLYNHIRVFLVKLITLYPVLEKSINKLIYFLENNKDTEHKILDKRDMKYVISRSPILFALANDTVKIEALLDNKRTLEIAKNMTEDIITLGNYLKNVNISTEVDFHKKFNTIIENIVNKKDNTIYSPLDNYIDPKSRYKSKNSIYRADGRSIKYRTIEYNKIIGIYDVYINNRTDKISSRDEEIISIPRSYSPDSLIKLLRKDLYYIADINTFHNTVKTYIKQVEDITKNVRSNFKKQTVDSNGYKALTIYYKLVKFITLTLPTELYLGHFKTAQDVYYACNKYADISYNRK